MRQMPVSRACSIESSLTTLLSPSVQSRKISPSCNSKVAWSIYSVSSAPSAWVIRLALGSSTVSSYPRDLAQARGLDVAVVACQLLQAPGPVKIDAAVAGPQAAAEISRRSRDRDGSADERHVTPRRFGAQVAIDLLQALHCRVHSLLEALRRSAGPPGSASPVHWQTRPMNGRPSRRQRPRPHDQTVPGTRPR